MEGALGYVLRIAQKIEAKISIEELNQFVQNDFEADVARANKMVCLGQIRKSVINRH